MLVGDVGSMDELAYIICYRIGSLLMNYLGMPLGSSFKATTVWNPILEKMEHRLFRLEKIKIIPVKRGKVDATEKYDLKSSNLLSFLVYHCFLWIGLGNEFKFHLVDWNTMCSPIVRRDLGVCKLSTLTKLS